MRRRETRGSDIDGCFVMPRMRRLLMLRLCGKACITTTHRLIRDERQNIAFMQRAHVGFTMIARIRGDERVGMHLRLQRRHHRQQEFRFESHDCSQSRVRKQHDLQQ